MATEIAANCDRLSPAQIQEYDANGFLALRGLFEPEEIDAVSVEVTTLLKRTDLIDTDNLRCRYQTDLRTGECRFETFDPIIDLSPQCARLAADRRLLDVLAALYGEPACLFKDKLIYKPPGLKGYGLHQDFIAWPGFPRSFLTALVPIDPCDVENGSTELFPGYHHGGSLTPEDGQYHELPPDSIDLTTGVKLELDRGDVAIFGGFTPHRSAPNLSDRWRRQLYLSYNATSDGGPRRDAHYAEFHRWLRKRYAEHGRSKVYFK